MKNLRFPSIALFYLSITLSFFAFSDTNYSVAKQSNIVQTQSEYCVEDNDQYEARRLALINARRDAAEMVKSKISSDSAVENFALQKDVVNAYSEASVKTVSIESERWDRASSCFFVSITAEVLPDMSDLSSQVKQSLMMQDPTAPLTVQMWTNKKEFTLNEQMEIYLRSNKPFYGRLLYIDADGTQLQILPNPRRLSNYLPGGQLIKIPDAGLGDTFRLVVSPPYGEERLVLMASTQPLGDIDLNSIGDVYLVDKPLDSVKQRTRGLKLVTEAKAKSMGATESMQAEFVESSLDTVIKPPKSG